jgi:orotidine-5'-phosphate decarboxylase
VTVKLKTGGVDAFTVHAYTAQDAFMQGVVEAMGRHGEDAAAVVRVSPPESCWAPSTSVEANIIERIAGILGGEKTK